jgi:tetratricopeptide (TPR) repeat protein
LIRLLLVAALLSAGPALAGPREEAKAHAERGGQLYKVGRFDQAIAEFSKAYELLPSAPVLFNLGQCYYAEKSWERAIFFFEGFLRDDPETPHRKVVEGLLDDARRNLATRPPPAVPPPAPPRRRLLLAAELAVAAVGLMLLGAGIYCATEPKLQIAADVLLPLGGAALAGGGVGALTFAF